MIVVDDVTAASDLVASGFDVVLVIPEGSDPGPLPEGPGRLAVMVGDPLDAETRSASVAMYAELFAPRP